MRTIKLAREWSFVSPEKTIDYPKGSHDVTNEIADAADAAGATEGTANGDRTSKAGAASAPDSAKG